VAAGRGTLLFIGVATQGSSIMKLFPRWAEMLRLDAGIEGWDIPLGAEPAVYRKAVRLLADDLRIAGALVTSHKVDVYRHAGALFDELDRYARLCREVSCISRRGARLRGHAKDPITAGRAMDDFLRPDHWLNREAQVLCLGAGGLALRSPCGCSPRRLSPPGSWWPTRTPPAWPRSVRSARSSGPRW